MSNKVFNNDVNDAPTNIPTWTVQSPLTGSNQNTVGNAPPASALLSATEVPAQTAIGQAQTGTTGDATAAKLSDLKTVAAAVDALNSALVAANLEV